ncbi:MAG: transcriptional regulator [Nitrospirales bacterium]|nr:MAG: transcriptional regulator [Nitrospirales bacterium]
MVTYKQAIKIVPLFSELKDQELNLLTASGSREKFPGKNMIFQEGDSGEVLFIILSGKVKVLLTGKKGQEFIFSHLGPGNFFREMAILESAPRSASVITIKPSEFFLLGQQALTELLTNHPYIAMKILKNLSQRLRKVSEQVRSLVMFDMYGRVGRCLLNLAEFQDGVETHGQLLISNRPSFQELANMVGCSRETLSRTLKSLKENGSLTVTRNTIYINRLWE